MGLFGDAAKAAGNAAKDSASKKLTGVSNVVHNCCGGKGKHLNGCDGKVHDFYGGVSHSGETVMSNNDMKQFKARGGSFHSARPDGNGKYVVHIKKMPRR